jgi:hypothetical protein
MVTNDEYAVRICQAEDDKLNKGCYTGPDRLNERRKGSRLQGRR